MQIRSNFLGNNTKQVAVLTVLSILSSASLNASENNWTEKISFSGDFRYRLEQINQEQRPDRERSRLRARLNIKAVVNKTVKLGMRLASGNDDPTTTNQSFDNFASTKGFGLDLAYVEWTPARGHNVIAGKMSVPFYKPGKSSLFWDSDLNPEGIAYKFARGNFFASIGRFNLDECSSCEDSYLTGGQVGYTWQTRENSEVNFGISRFEYDLNIVEVGAVFNYRVNGQQFGLAESYSLTDIFADYSTKINSRPLSVYVNYALNDDASILSTIAGLNNDLDAGYEIGVNYGKVKNRGDWALGYLYKNIDAFSVFPLFTDSDFAGGGGDSSGHIVKLIYGVNKNFSVGITQYINQARVSAGEDNITATRALDYNRTQLDFKFKF